MLARVQGADRPRLRIYIGAAPGVGKTYSMLRTRIRRAATAQDVVVGIVETYGRADTEAQLRDLEIVPRRSVEYRGVVLEEMDVEAILAPAAAAVCRRRARAHQRARQPSREAVSGRARAAGQRHRRDDRRQHPAPRDAERRRGPGDRRARPRDGAGHVPRSRRRSRQRGRHGRGAAQPAASGQDLQA